MKSAFPWFGGKRRAAGLVWSRFGDVVNYVEPFAGSLAVLLERPHWPFCNTRTETVNDKDAYIGNFWRAIKANPEAVAEYADNPVNECDLHARHRWLHGQAAHVERLKCDPDYFDARIAGYWCWGLSSWIGNNFCRPTKQEAMPHLGDNGRGISGPPGGCEDRRARILAYFASLADRMRGVRVCCGDWSRVLGPATTYHFGLTGVFLDPPYDVDGMDYGADHTGLSTAVREWALANGNNPLLRIALCGYVDESHSAAMPREWECVAWKAGGGYNNLGDGQNRKRERIWFSPHCLRADIIELSFDLQPTAF